MLLERGDHLRALGAALEEVRVSRVGSIVLLAGDAGAGKTSLLRSFVAEAPEKTLWGSCEPLLTPTPLGPVLDIAETVGGELLELADRGARPHEIATGLIRELRSGGTTILVLEDMHWADEATLDVVTLLGRRVETASVLLAISFRDDELDRAPKLRGMLGELGGGPLRLRLAPLSLEAVRELAEDSELDASELYERTAGNPFFVTEALAASDQSLPETVRDAVLARAARLSPAARELLEAVAIVPGHAERWLVEALAGDLDDPLDECVAAGALNADVSFRHELARLAIDSAIAPSRARALHLRALEALAASPEADPARLAHHADAAGDAQAVLRTAPRAGERAAAAGAHREAAAQYARALRYAAGEPLATRAALLERRAEECYTSAQFHEAIGAQREALAARRELGEQRAYGDAMRALSRLLFFDGQVAEGEELALEAVARLEAAGPCHELAMAYGNLSQRRMVVHDSPEALGWGERALELAGALGDTEVEAYVLTNMGMAQLQGADPEEGRRMLERALELAQRDGLEEHAGRAFNALAMVPVRRRDFPLARTYIERGLDYCADRGVETWRLYLLAVLARLELDAGHWDATVEAASTVVRGTPSSSLAHAWAVVALSVARMRRGDLQRLDTLDHEHEIAAATREVERIAQVTAARAEAAWLSGEAGRVASLTADGLALALDRGDAWSAGEIAVWAMRTGTLIALPDELEATPFSLSIAGDWAGAAESWRALGCPYDAALALADGEELDALGRAHEDLQALGAAPAAANVARKLRRLGGRGVRRGPRRRTRENPAGLTARELEVAELLAEGLRNAEIAERLVVSERTVDHHVSAILRKLDARTRGQAAAEAMRLGVVPKR